MTVPAYLLDGERYEHGTRARYNSKCRCDACRRANTTYEKERQAKARAAAGALAPAATAPIRKVLPGGRVSTFKRACTGVNGAPCPRGSHLRIDSTGDVCGSCRLAVAWNGLVDVAAVLAHIESLSAQGVGRKSVCAAADVPYSTIGAMLRGDRKWIRAQMAQRILAVDASAVADHGLVPAAETQRLLREIIRLGFTRTSVAAKLGSTAKVPTLQYKRPFVLAKTAQRVARLHAELYAGEEDDLGPEMDPIDESPRARILRAIRFFDKVTAFDLFDAMDIEPMSKERNTYTVTIGRLVKTGELERSGDRQPFHYRLPEIT